MAFSKSIEELIQEDTSGLLSKHDSWERVLLSDIAEVLNGYAFPSSYFNSAGKGLPLIRIRDVMSGKTETFYSGPFENEFLVENGDLLIGMDGDFNSSYWCGGKALLNQRVCKISVFSNHYHKKFLGYLLPNYLNAINQNTSSTTVKHLSSATISNILLPLPPENEQVRIIEKLDTLLSDLDKGVAELKTAQEKLTQYRQTLLKSAVDGTLTKEWRKLNAHEIPETGEQLLVRILKERRARWEKQKLEEFASKGQTPPKDWQKKYPEPVVPDTSGLPELPEGWVWASVDQLSLNKRYGSSSKTNDDKNGVPVLRMGNIQDGRIDYSNLKYLPNDHDEFPNLFLSDGDLVFNRTNSFELVGKTAIFRDIGKPCSFASYLIAVRFSDLYIPDLAAYYLNSSYGREWITSVVTQTAGQANVNGTKLGELAIPLPPILEQLKIIELISKLHQEHEVRSKSILEGLAHTESQRKNIIKDAFSGKLVEQDPYDEPASALLERIKAEREARDKLPKPKKSKKVEGKSDLMKTLSEVLKANGDWMDAQEAFAACGVGDGTDTDKIEKLYADLRILDKAGQLLTKRQGHYDMIKLKDI